MKAFLLVLAACGSPKPALDDPPARHRATQVWGDDCLPKVEDRDPCVKVTAADASAIRDAILGYLRDVKDLPDASLVERLALPPIAQWTTSAYEFRATTAGGHEAVSLRATDQVDSTMTAGFTCTLSHADGAWTVISLSPYAAQ